MSEINISIQDNSTNVTITQNEAIAAVSHYTVNISLSCCTGAIPDLMALDEYPNMEDAIAGGVGLHELYWASEATDSLIAGGLYRVTSV
jgi:hypothetical protein